MRIEQPEFWDKNCHYGRACLFSGGNGVYNADRCLDNFDVNFYFDRALAHANAFTLLQEW